MNLTKYIPHIILSVLFIVMGFDGLLNCGGSNNNTSAPSITQAMGDQDVQLGNLSVSVAGQPGNWQGEGEAIMVYILTINFCVESGTVFVKVPAATQAVPAPTAPFVLKVTCTEYINNVAQKPTNWIITGFTDAQGKITGARATKEG